MRKTYLQQDIEAIERRLEELEARVARAATRPAVSTVQSLGATSGAAGYVAYFATSTALGGTGIYYDSVNARYGFGTATPEATLDLYAATTTDGGSYYGRNADVAHGMTNLAPTTAFVQIMNYSAGSGRESGGALIRGLSSSIPGNTPGLVMMSCAGGADYTVYPATILNAGKKSGVTIGTLADADLAYVFQNAWSTKVTIYGSGKISTLSSVQATTGIFTDLTDNYIPKHVNDTSGLANSTISDTGTLITLAAGGAGTLFNRYGVYVGANAATAATPLWISTTGETTFKMTSSLVTSETHALLNNSAGAYLELNKRGGSAAGTTLGIAHAGMASIITNSESMIIGCTTNNPIHFGSNNTLSFSVNQYGLYRGANAAVAATPLWMTSGASIGGVIETTLASGGSFWQANADSGQYVYMGHYGTASADTLETLTLDNRAVIFSNNTEGMIICSNTAGSVQQPIIFATRESAGANTMSTMYFVGDALNAEYESDTDNAALWINYAGYRGANTRYRDTYICDGKYGTIAFFDGSAGTTDLYGKLTVDHIGEHTGSHGVAFDNKVLIDHVGEATGSHNIAFDNKVLIDHIGEATASHKVVFDNTVSAAKILSTRYMGASGDGGLLCSTYTIAAGASTALEPLLGSATTLNGVLMLMIKSAGTQLGGMFSIMISSVLLHNFGYAAATDTASAICVIADGDGTFTLKNNLAAEVTCLLLYLGDLVS